MDGKTKGSSKIRRVFFATGIVLIVLFGFMLVCNLIIIIKGVCKPEDPPKIFGVMPMVVRSGSMSGDAKDHIETDDLIIVHSIKPDKLKVGDIIAFMNEDRTVVTHRIVSIESEEGELLITTRGDANNVNDDPITSRALIGIYKWRIPKLGGFVIFLQTPAGMVLALGVPIALFFAVDLVIRHKKKLTESRAPVDHTTESSL